MAQQIQLRNDSTLAWEEENPILAQGEFGVDTTLGKFKIGDGTSTWTELQFQTGNIADFVFAYDSEDGSTMTVTDHDMTIQTVRDNDPVTSDADINIEAADDVWIRAYGDEIGIYAADEVTIQTNSYRGDGTSSSPLYGSRQDWIFDKNGRITFPDGSMQISAGQSLDPLEPFLTWEEQRGHLQYLNTHFGWDSDGVWFTGAAEGGSSYPIFTNFTIPQNVGVTVSFDVNINSECADMGVAIYNAATTPQWDDNPNTTRIAAQFSCLDLLLSGRTTEVTSGEGEGVPGDGIYTVTFTYNPTASTDKVTVSYTEEGSTEVIASLSLNEALPSGPYRVGFAADQNNPSVRTYMSNLGILTSNDVIDEYSSLTNGDSTIVGGGSANLVVPTAIKDGDGDDFITFTRTSTGTARIGTPQDDLSLRSARDITLIAGDNGPGNVYIGWGDATITPDATNRVATIGDIQSISTGDFEFNDNVMFTEDTSTRIEARRDSLRQGSAIEFDPYDGHVALYGYTGGTTNSYSTSDWTGDATWSSSGEGNSQVVLNGATALVTFLNETFNQAPVRSLSINGSDYYEFDGFGGNSENVTLYTIGGAPLQSTTVTSLEFRYQIRSVIEINEDNEEILIEGNELAVQIRTTENKDIIINSSDDLELKARDEIRLYTNTDDSELSWSMTSEGSFRLPGDGYISNPANSSGDGSNNDTIKIVPDDDREDTDQYLIIDPTLGTPNHIHIRAGGAQDYSRADLILGGERAGVRVSDSEGISVVQSKQADDSWTYQNIDPAGGVVFVVDTELAEPDIGDFMVVNGVKYVISSVTRDLGNTYYQTTPSFTFEYGASYTFTRDNGNYAWTFASYDDNPALILPPGDVQIVNLAAPGSIHLGAFNGVELTFAEGEGNGLKFPDETVQTTAYVPGADVPVEVVFSVNGGSLGTMPTFNGAPLFTGSYVKHGPMVHFQIQVDMDNILTFGTGQYYVDLPFDSKYAYQLKDGCLHHISTGNQYAIGGHVAAGTRRLFLTFIGSNGQDEVFDYNSPVTLATADNFHVSGTYIAS